MTLRFIDLSRPLGSIKSNNIREITLSSQTV
nr:MAG TPA: hypothetical protein [Caudoviricetes sp.]